MVEDHVSLLYFFFFSSRRRHTRLQGDWSSDVCSSDLGPQKECCCIGNDRTAGLYFHYLSSLYNQPLSINSLVQFIILIILFFSLLFIPIQSDHLCMSGLFFSKIDVCSLQITIVSPGWLVIGWVGEWEQAIFSPYTSGPGPTVQITMVANKKQIIEGCL